LSDYKQILISIDFSESCQQVLARGTELARQNQATVRLIHVVEHLPPMDFGYEPVSNSDWYFNENEIIKQAEKNLERVANENDIDKENIIVLVGAPKTEIVRYAADKQIDLIVIGSHGRHGIQRLLGSTAYPVLHSAHCDVLAVRITG